MVRSKNTCFLRLSDAGYDVWTQSPLGVQCLVSAPWRTPFEGKVLQPYACDPLEIVINITAQTHEVISLAPEATRKRSALMRRIAVGGEQEAPLVMRCVYACASDKIGLLGASLSHEMGEFLETILQMWSGPIQAYSLPLQLVHCAEHQSGSSSQAHRLYVIESGAAVFHVSVCQGVIQLWRTFVNQKQNLFQERLQESLDYLSEMAEVSPEVVPLGPSAARGTVMEGLKSYYERMGLKGDCSHIENQTPDSAWQKAFIETLAGIPEGRTKRFQWRPLTLHNHRRMAARWVKGLALCAVLSLGVMYVIVQGCKQELGTVTPQTLTEGRRQEQVQSSHGALTQTTLPLLSNVERQKIETLYQRYEETLETQSLIRPYQEVIQALLHHGIIVISGSYESAPHERLVIECAFDGAYANASLNIERDLEKQLRDHVLPKVTFDRGLVLSVTSRGEQGVDIRVRIEIAKENSI